MTERSYRYKNYEILLDATWCCTVVGDLAPGYLTGVSCRVRIRPCGGELETSAAAVLDNFCAFFQDEQDAFLAGCYAGEAMVNASLKQGQPCALQIADLEARPFRAEMLL